MQDSGGGDISSLDLNKEEGGRLEKDVGAEATPEQVSVSGELVYVVVFVALKSFTKPASQTCLRIFR